MILKLNVIKLNVIKLSVIMVNGVMPIDWPGDPNHSSGHVPNQLLPGGEKTGVGSAIEKWDPEPLGRPDSDVDPELAGRLQQGEGHQVSGTHCQGLKWDKQTVLFGEKSTVGLALFATGSLEVCVRSLCTH